jgi:hypothetical protein
MGVAGATSSQTEETQSWSAQIAKDYSYLDSRIEQLLEVFGKWSATNTSSSNVNSAINEAFPQFVQTLHALAVQAPLRWSRTALMDYRAAAELYLEAARVEASATQLSTSPLQKQLQNSESRIRQLGDRIYDQAGAALAPYLPAPPKVPGVTVVTLPPVPNWIQANLLPGPPLDRRGGPTFARSIAASSWRDAVKNASIPSAFTETAAIRLGDERELRTVSDEFLFAASYMSKAPNPPGGVVVLVNVRLALLVDSEAARAAESAQLTSAPVARSDLKSVAEALAVIGNDLWDQRIEFRSVNFNSAVLTQTAS